MNISPTDLTDEKTFTASLLERFLTLKESKPSARTRELTDELGISEGTLLSVSAGPAHGKKTTEVIRLTSDPEALLKGLEPIGKMMALTRNNGVVHERKGVYEALSFFRTGHTHTGLALGKDIDLRLFLNHWHHCFAVCETAKTPHLKSLQFFDEQGKAVHKIYCTKDSDQQAFESLVKHFSEPDQSPRPLPKLPEAPPSIAKVFTLPKKDTEAFRNAWRNLKDVHHFHPLLHKFNLDRQSAFRCVEGEFTQAVEPCALEQALSKAKDCQLSLMIFVANKGCIQIHHGPVNRLLERGPWFNVMDPDFNLHANRDDIKTAWVVRKPTSDGIITSIECFDEEGNSLITLFGERVQHQPEVSQWREIVASIEASCATNNALC